MKLCELTFVRFQELQLLWGWGVTAAEAIGVALVVVPLIRVVKRWRARKAAAAAPPDAGELTRGLGWVRYERRQPRWARKRGGPT